MEFTMWYIVILFVGMGLFSFYSYKKNTAKQEKYFKDQTGDKAKEDLRLKTLLIEVIEKSDPNIKAKIILNGHYIKWNTGSNILSSLTRKSPDTYSYVIALDKEKAVIDVFNYQPATKQVVTVGTFTKDQVKLVERIPAETRFAFFDEQGRQSFVIDVKSEIYASETNTAIAYSQLEEYNEYRSFFGLEKIQGMNA